MLPRSFWAVTVAAAAAFRAVCTSPSFWAKSCRGAIKATVVVRLSMQESSDEKYGHPISWSYKVLLSDLRIRWCPTNGLRRPEVSIADYSKAAAALAAPLKNASKSALIWSGLVVHMPCGRPG